MVSSGLDSSTAILKHRASGYSGPNMAAEYFDPSTLSGAGGMYSTSEDLLRWDQALYTTTLLSRESLDLMFTPHVEFHEGGPGHLVHYGYGWFMDNLFGQDEIDHGGHVNGFDSAIIRFPNVKITVIVLSNREDTPSWEIAKAISGMIFEQE